MEQTPRREERPIRSRRLRAALKSSAQVCVAAVACALWIGLALPGLQLLPGVGDLANTSSRNLVAERAARHRRHERASVFRVRCVLLCERLD